VSKPETEWDGAAVRRWLAARVEAARADQVAAERHGWERRDDCDKAAAEEMACATVGGDEATDSRDAFLRELKRLLDRDAYVWRGVYDDDRFDRHVRSALRRLTKMARTNAGFENTRRYQ
jgi:hypothetical protein